MIPEYLIKKLEELNIEWEIYAEKYWITSVKAKKREKVEVEIGKHTISGGIGLRVIYGGHLGFSYVTGTPTKEDVEMLIKRALKLARVGKVTHPGLPTPKKVNAVKIYDKRIANLTVEDIIEHLLFLVDVEANSQGSIGFGEGERDVVNSNGINLREDYTYLGIFLEVFKKNKGIGGEEKTFRLMPKIDDVVEEVRRKALWEFELSSKAKRLESYEGEIILEPKALLSILSILIPNFSAKNVYYKRSRFSSLGERVSKENFSLIDDPTIEGGVSSFSFDGEGNPGIKKYLIKDGLVSSFLADEKYGRLLGITGGNAMRSFSSLPGIGTSNLVIPPGNTEPEEGVFIRRVYGEHTANPVSGDFSLNIGLGYIIKDGEVMGFKDNMLIGNIFAMLNNILEVGKRVEEISGAIFPKIATNLKIV